MASLLSMATTEAQSTTSAQIDKDAVLLSQTSDGKMVTSRYLIKGKEAQKATFVMHFTINHSNMLPTFADNSQQVADLKAFASKMKDTLMHLHSTTIVGYASPDGGESFNKSLAGQRAATVKNYLHELCPNLKPSWSAHPYTWKDAMSAVEKSDIPQKGEVLRILALNVSDTEKEKHLKRLPAAWDYLKKSILPGMRKAEITFTYMMDSVMEKRVAVTPPPAPKPAPAAPATTKPAEEPKPVPMAIVEEVETGIIVDMTDVESRREMRQERKRERQNR